jgi:hypothetical protein
MVARMLPGSRQALIVLADWPPPRRIIQMQGYRTTNNRVTRNALANTQKSASKGTNVTVVLRNTKTRDEIRTYGKNRSMNRFTVAVQKKRPPILMTLSTY